MAVESHDRYADRSALSAGLSRLSNRYLAVEMPGEEGPDGKQHYPAYASGCYYDRPESCCTFCYLRKAFDS
ncbi:hypothetical protein [Haloarcula onubensis]|uniref:Uncharacterized protein n=1 Tax=Haloarcula onubensis TaxID=2950539 RepID=A0ABU2FKP7_9EURY|nr:hypothetical protein [Halomicroarcula sp. S3CR25-11]MDS0280776.1 hypothetical protein [Halomicroarcula sp. S3CR25-11]